MGHASDARNFSHRERRLLLWRAVMRPLLLVSVCLAAYFVLPWTSIDDLSVLAVLIGGLLVVLVIGAWQIQRIMSSEAPVLQGVEALAVILPVYLLGFSVTYLLISERYPEYFSEPLTRMGALYFSLTVFSTVGFGDIVAVADAARAIVSVQIVGNMILIGAGIRLVVAVVGWASRRRH
ncbi:ion channel family protein [Rhodococcus sp. WMMA185]|uniref:potassium channel family protein n=1 Tax=Rhodococcus sp. WMMA185 TaxID=679318 RepID=UPI0008789369|nr:potassium channel family protein [Rhodococcus sp. WMMA185]AOW92116.1 ion channel family protein [Rhodococcus sp. WMMA185]